MGCLSSKKEVDDIYPNVFQVMNVDEHGNRINPGQLEITDVDLVLYQQGKPPIKWPLRTLRRYGFDSEHFSFESGRRCQTGPGIYAFRCRRAEQLFNLLQSRIQLRNNGDVAVDNSENIPTSGTNRDPSYLEPTPIRRCNPGSRFSAQNGIQLSSAVSNSGSIGPLSPQSTTSQSFPMDSNTVVNPLPASRPPNQNLYANEEVIASVIQNVVETSTPKPTEEPVSPSFCHSYTNSAVIESLSHKEMNSEGVHSEATAEAGRVYMNVMPGLGSVMSRLTSLPQAKAPSAAAEWETEEPAHTYANFDAEAGMSKATTPPTPRVSKNLNYIVIELKNPESKPAAGSLPPDSPRKLTGGYAAIDFKKTVALSHSVNPNFDNDSEGSRRTRHNSNITDLIGITRHSSSVSD